MKTYNISSWCGGAILLGIDANRLRAAEEFSSAAFKEV
jgi:hypothetical protein